MIACMASFAMRTMTIFQHMHGSRLCMHAWKVESNSKHAIVWGLLRLIRIKEDMLLDRVRVKFTESSVV